MSISRYYIDAHVHIADVSGLDAVAEAGITAVRDAGMLHCTDCRSLQEGARVRVVSACQALYREGGYGSRFGVPVRTREAAQAEIVRLKDAGAGIIKVMASGMVSMKNPGAITPGGFDAHELVFIVNESASLGLGVMAHANGEAAILACAEAGVRSIEHGFFMTERALDRMAKKRIFWVPTTGALARAADSDNASSTARAVVQDLVKNHIEMIGHAHRLGVPLAIGTDCVLPDPRYREAYDAELAYFEQAEIPREQVLRIACKSGAELLGI